jgi:hypothetical protein
MIAQYRVYNALDAHVADVCIDVSADEVRWGASLACEENLKTAEILAEVHVTGGVLCFAHEEHYTRHALPEGEGWQDVSGGEKPARLRRIG